MLVCSALAGPLVHLVALVPDPFGPGKVVSKYSIPILNALTSIVAHLVTE